MSIELMNRVMALEARVAELERQLAESKVLREGDHEIELAKGKRATLSLPKKANA